ncbi:MAG: phosphoribosylanthranilate isomerase [Planctomycetota bacterium]|nr:phosphoribosylanthranilate isomerase [Planctomycetota bacterium]
MPVRTRIKICGVRDEETAKVVADCGADAIGFVFARSSPRYIEPEEAWELVSRVPFLTSTVGVFLNANVDAFCDIEEKCPTSYVQLHGSQDEATVIQCGPNVIRAVQFGSETIAGDLARWSRMDEVDAILVDSPTPGSGVAFEWSQLAPHVRACPKPIMLAGGLTPSNVAQAVREIRPFGVDVSSGVERERGVKDPELIRQFCDAVREADRG